MLSGRDWDLGYFWITRIPTCGLFDSNRPHDTLVVLVEPHNLPTPRPPPPQHPGTKEKDDGANRRTSDHDIVDSWGREGRVEAAVCLVGCRHLGKLGRDGGESILGESSGKQAVPGSLGCQQGEEFRTSAREGVNHIDRTACLSGPRALCRALAMRVPESNACVCSCAYVYCAWLRCQGLGCVFFMLELGGTPLEGSRHRFMRV
jgi:hypothetical protein